MASFYTRGFHLGRQLLSPSHSHFQSGPVYSLWQAGTSLGQPATDDEKRLGTIKTTAPAGTISSAPWGLASKAQAKLVNNGPSQASLASAFPSRLSSPAGPGSSAVVRPETKDPLANMGLDMLDSVAGPFDPFREEVSGVVDMAVVGAMTGNHGLAKPTLAVLPSPPTTPSSSPTPPVTRQQHQPQPNVHLRDHSELIKQLGKEGGWERVKNLWEELQRKGVQVDLATRNAYLEHLGRHPSRLPLARSFFLALPPSSRNLATYNVMVKMHSVAQLPELAESYYSAISTEGGAVRGQAGWVVSRLEPNVVSRTHLLDAYARTGQLPPSLLIFSEILASRPAPTPDQFRVAYKHLLVAHVNAGDLPGAMREFHAMRHRRIPPDPFVYALLISKSATIDDGLEVLRMWTGRLNSQIYEALLSLHFSHFDSVGAWRWFGQMGREGMRPSPRTWRIIARGVLGDSGTEDELDEGKDVMLGQGALPDSWGILESLGMSDASPASTCSGLESLLDDMSTAGLSKPEQERVVNELLGVVGRTRGYKGLERRVRGLKASLGARR